MKISPGDGAFLIKYIVYYIMTIVIVVVVIIIITAIPILTNHC